MGVRNRGLTWPDHGQNKGKRLIRFSVAFPPQQRLVITRAAALQSTRPSLRFAPLLVQCQGAVVWLLIAGWIRSISTLAAVRTSGSRADCHTGRGGADPITGTIT